MVSERSESLNEQKQGQKNNDNELLSFEELKNKVNHETAKDEKPDSEINDLLSALGDSRRISHSLSQITRSRPKQSSLAPKKRSRKT